MEGLASFRSQLYAFASLVHLNMRLAKVEDVLAEVAENILRGHLDQPREQAFLFSYRDIRGQQKKADKWTYRANT